MNVIYKRILLSTLPIIYLILIWLQSNFFNPESLTGFSNLLSMEIILLIGVCLEITHLFEFGFLYLLIILSLLSFGKLTKWKEIIAITISIIYGVGDEIHQLFVPYRSASVEDIVKNTIGILTIWWVIHISYRNENSRLGRILKKFSYSSKG